MNLLQFAIGYISCSTCMNQQIISHYIFFHDVFKAFLVTSYPISFFQSTKWKPEFKSLFSPIIRNEFFCSLKKKMNQCSLFLMCVFVWIILSLGGLFGHGVSFPKEFNDLWLIIHTLVWGTENLMKPAFCW